MSSTGLVYIFLFILLAILFEKHASELPGRFGAMTGKISQIVAAPVTFCVSLLLVLLNILMMFVLLAGAIMVVLKFFPKEPSLDGALFGCITALMSLWAGVAISRLSSFMFPRVLGSLTTLTRRPSICVMILAIALVIWFLLSIQSPFRVVYVLIFILPLVNAHQVRQQEGALEDSLPFVLFLRRFSGFGERVVFGSVLRAAPSRMTVGVLRDQGNRAVGWDPLLLGLAGIKLKDILGHTPRCFISPHDSWEEAVCALAHRAAWIVVDVSEFSDSIKLELNLLNENKLFGKTILVENAEAEPSSRVLESFGISLEKTGARVFRYREKWSPLHFAFLLFEGGLIFFCWIMVDAFMRTSELRLGPFWGAMFWLVGLYFIAFFLKPKIDRSFTRDLRRILLRDNWQAIEVR